MLFGQILYDKLLCPFLYIFLNKFMDDKPKGYLINGIILIIVTIQIIMIYQY